MKAQQSGVSNLCPADDFSVGFELGAMEDLDADDGLHRLPIDGTDDAENTQNSVLNKTKAHRIQVHVM